MAKFDLDTLPKAKRIQMISEFYDVVSLLKDRGEVRMFFRDLLSPDEMAMLMRRIEVAALLLAGFTYDEIAALLGVGKDKVINVKKSLSRHGEGYKTITKRLLSLRKAKIKRSDQQEKRRHSSFQRLKDKYPLHFLLFHLIDEIGEFLEEGKEKEKEALLDTPSKSAFKKLVRGKKF